METSSYAAVSQLGCRESKTYMVAALFVIGTSCCHSCATSYRRVDSSGCLFTSLLLWLPISTALWQAC